MGPGDLPVVPAATRSAGIVAAVGSEVTAEEFEVTADERVDAASSGHIGPTPVQALALLDAT